MKISVTETDSKHRADIVLTAHITELSRSYIRKLFDDGRVTVEGTPIRPKDTLKPGTEIDVAYDMARTESIPKISLRILYEDDDCLVIEKPEGVLTHSKGSYNPEATVATFMADKIDLSGFLMQNTPKTSERAGIVHRLDRATSGVIICAKTPLALTWLQKQFSQRKVKKTYVAIVTGHVSPGRAVIEMPIARHPVQRKKFHVSPDGKPAITEYEVTKSCPGYDMLVLRPSTGRTHQLRVHLSQIGHPIVGDSVYGKQTAERMFLHAEQLELTLPSKQRKVFVSPLPHSFNDFIDKKL
jgi:23S rRNA pseudouridine1911/1915/1917 synthase